MSVEKEIDGYKVVLRLRPNELLDVNRPPPFYLDRPNIRAAYKGNTTGEIYNAVDIPYFITPKATEYPLDLNKGFDQFIIRRELTLFHYLNKVQKFVLDAEENFLWPGVQRSVSSSGIQSQPQPRSERKAVLSTRGVLSRIMLIPYRLRGSEENNMRFFATRYCDIIHLGEIKWKGGQDQKYSHHGKFAQYCFTDDPDLDPITNVPVDENIINFCVYTSKMKEFDLIYSAEVQGILSDHKVDMENMDLLNNSQFILTKLLWSKGNKEHISKNPKFLLWWLQSYLANINDICIGLKDSNGMVKTPVKLFKVQDMPKDQYWKPHICIRFLHTMLTLIEQTMADVNCPYTVYEFLYDSYTRTIKLKTHIGKTNCSFLSEEYIKNCKQRTDCK